MGSLLSTRFNANADWRRRLDRPASAAVAVTARDAIGHRIRFLNVECVTHGIGDERHSLIFAERRGTGDAQSAYSDGHVHRIWQGRPSFDRQFDLRHRRNGGGGDGESIWRNIVPPPGGDCAHAADPTTTELTKRTAPKWMQVRRSADWTIRTF